MTQPMRSEAIKTFLIAKTHLDLSALYNLGMEVQVNVAQDNGERVAGNNEYTGKQWLAWTDGCTTWKSFRIPYHANTEPEYTDKIMTYDIAHAEGIGMTGWNWQKRLSLWFAYDFDALTGHSERHAKKLTDSELGDIREVVKRVPWVTLRTSTSGKGLHLYVFLANPIETRNHHEHAALARAILNKLSALCTFDFNSKVDICGGNMWVWHRKMYDKVSGERIGLKIIKSGDKLEQVPPNWRDHLNVIRGKTSKTKPIFVESTDTEDIFNELTGQRSKIALDPEHKRLIDFLQERNCTWWWDQDHWMLVTHTYNLKQAHNVLDMKGVFETLATGSDTSDHNCFAYPLPRGSWAVRRYSPGTKEADTWEQDGQTWTKCFLNRDVDFDTACKLNRGNEHPKGGYHFPEVQYMLNALKILGCSDLTVHPAFMGRVALLQPHKQEGKVIASFPSEKSDVSGDMDGWINERNFWKKVVQIKVPPKLEGENDTNYDDLIRHLITPNNEDCGWVLRTEGNWNQEPLVHIRAALDSMAYNRDEKNDIVGENIFKPWRLVNLPFKSEYPGDRSWNRNAAQLRFVPNPEPGDHKHWDIILEHCGISLDEAIKEHPWCKINGIVKGAEYLRCWIASLIKEPHAPLPYLFFYSQEQDTGKSTFHEALELLLTRGYMRADTALTSQSGFNGELENVVLCVVEETDLKKNNTAYARIKDWVTSINVSIHRKQRTPYMVPNTTHWLQCANDRTACPVFPGDTRITMIYVPPLAPEQKMPKKELIKVLEKEAPDFLASILRLELPSSGDRLNLPILITEDKLEAQGANQTELQTFIEEKCVEIPGQRILFSEFYGFFIEWLPAHSVINWSKKKVSIEIPSKFPRGRCTDNPNAFIGNLSFDPAAEPGQPYHKEGMWIKQKDENHSIGSPQANGQRHIG